MLLCSPAGGDLLYDDSLPEQGRNFGNKIWNAFRLIRQWEVDHEIEQPESAKAAIIWFEHKLYASLAELEDQYDKYRISDALMTLYRLFWDEFSAWYLESIKPPYGKPIDATYQGTDAPFPGYAHPFAASFHAFHHRTYLAINGREGRW